MTKSILEKQYSEDARQRLVETIEKVLGHPLAPQIRRAFLAVAREQFVPVSYVQEQPGIWKAYEAPDVYQDKVLVTKINEQGHPCSSSSMPSIMAAMLEALDIAPGSRILEIGTGTGYNAALLAELVGPDGQVVSIDIDGELVTLASARLKEAGYFWVQVATANGLTEHAPVHAYDRIIVTAGYPGIAPSWIAQLAVGGVLVGNLLGSLATPLFRLRKNADGTMSGTLLTTPAFFMPLSGGPSSRPTGVNFARFEALPCIEQVQTTIDVVNRLYDQSFGLFLEAVFPGLERRQRYLGGSPKNIGTCLIWKDTLLTLAPLDEEAGMSASQWAVETRGHIPLWSMVQSSYEQWVRQGKAPIDRYRMNVSQGGDYRIFLATNEEEAAKNASSKS